MPKEPQLEDSAPWKERYRAPNILWTQLAREEPARGLVCSNRSGMYQLYAWDVPTGELRQLTYRPKGILWGGVLSPDGRYLYYLDDKEGNEVGHYVRVPFEGGEPQDVTPNLPPYSSWDLAVSRAGNVLAMFLADQKGFHLYALDLDRNGNPAEPRLLYESPALHAGLLLSHDGELAAAASTASSGSLHYTLPAFDVGTGETVAELSDGEGNSIEPVTFSPIAGDLRLLATTNRSGDKRPLLWNPRTGERTDLPLDQLDGEVIPMDWSDDGKRLLLCQFSRAVQQLYIYDLESGQLTKLNHPEGSYGFGGQVGTYFHPDGEIFTEWQDSANPPQLIALDGRTGARTRAVLKAGDVPPGHPWKSITFTSSDGQEIQGWLGLPDGQGPFPTILHTHGGPEAVTTLLFASGSQAWLDHGFAFLTINYRGSTTFGKEFQEKIWGHPGDWEVEDVVAAREWLVREKIANPDQVFLTGGSYGGYLTLLPMGKRPGLWAGGMAVVAVADWRLMYEDEADTIRAYDVAMFGGTPDEKPEEHAKASPLTYVQNVDAPLLIIQGRNDTRCPERQMEVYVEKLKELGKPFEIVWFEAGHGSFEIEEQIHQQELMLRFAHRVLAGDKELTGTATV